MLRAAATVFHSDFARGFEQLSGAVLVVLDTQGRIEAINARGCTLLGENEADLPGLDFVECTVPPEQRLSARAHLSRVSKLAPGATHEFEVGFRSAQGLPRLMSWRCMARFDATGLPTGQLCHGEDTTDRRRDEELARRSSERLLLTMRAATIGEMAAGIAHEINQPLAAIVNYAKACEHFLAHPAPDIADLREAVREIGAEALRAGDIVHCLRQLVRDEKSVRTPTGINEVFEELRLLSQADARAFDTQIEFTSGAGTPRVHMDRDQMTHALLNLIRNALESVSTDPPGKRRIVVQHLQEKPGCVDIRICDNGPGVDPGIIQRMFDPFCTTKTTGAGLGLPMSRTIVQVHRGQLSFEPARPRGACFTVTLPVCGEETA